MESILVKEVNGNFTNQSSKESFTFSCFNDDNVPYDEGDHDHELFFDMDITLPFAWEHHHHHAAHHNITGSSCLPETQEFEFSITFSEDGSSTNGIMGALSPADDLFYKGQLLPLHLPPRLRMVEHLSSKNTSQENGTTYEESIDVRTHQTLDISKLISRQKYSLSCQGSHVEGAQLKGGSSTMVKSHGSWIDVTEIQDANVFPNCYKDSALQMINQDEGNDDVKCRSSKVYTRPSLRWKVLLPGSRRSCQKIEIITDKSNDPRKLKDGQKWGFSTLKLRASASFLKSFFTAGDLGRVLVHHKQQKYYAHNERLNEETSINTFKKGDCMKHPLGLTNGAEAHLAERDRITSKARDYLQKYVKLFKSMYVMLSHTNEQPRSLLENNFSIDGPVSTVSSSSCKTKQKPIVEPKPVIRSLIMETLRTTSFSKRSKSTAAAASKVTNISHSGVLRSDEACVHCGDSSYSVSNMEEENSIQGAIAHCKQSSAQSSSDLLSTLKPDPVV